MQAVQAVNRWLLLSRGVGGTAVVRVVVGWHPGRSCSGVGVWGWKDNGTTGWLVVVESKRPT